MAAPYPTFNGVSLQDDNYITSELIYRNTPDRDLQTAVISRRAGVKLVATDFMSRSVTINGSIIADTPDELQSLIDNLHVTLTNQESVTMYVSSNRSGTVTLKSIGISDSFYTQTYVPFSIELLMTDPFFYGPQQVINYTIPAGTVNFSNVITISGSAYAEPAITYNAPAGGGYTTTSGIVVTYNATAEHITWSGTGGVLTLAQGSNVTFDYDSHRILLGITETSIEGVFSRWQPGPQSYTVTFSGTAQGGTLAFAYQPRYY